MRKTELLAPAGNFATARAAFAAGADAVYCGLKDFSARSFADNFSFEEMRDLLCVARAQSKKVYVTFNTVIDEADFPRAVRTLARLEDLRPDGVIVQDLGVARVCRRHFPGLALHASTQLVAHNLEGVLAMREIGFSRVVLARELSLASSPPWKSTAPATAGSAPIAADCLTKTARACVPCRSQCATCD